MRINEELRKRCKAYASEVVKFYVTLPPKRKEVEVLGHQLLRSGTSVAAHSREASRARSDAEFCSKLDGLLQEADEPKRSEDRLSSDSPQGEERIKANFASLAPASLTLPGCIPCMLPRSLPHSGVGLNSFTRTATFPATKSTSS